MFLLIVLACSSLSLNGQSKQQSISLTTTGHYLELAFYVKGEELWIDLNQNGEMDADEAIVSGKKTTKELVRGQNSYTVYGKTITSLTINDFETPDQVRDITLANAPLLETLNLNENPIRGDLNLTPLKKLTEVKLKGTMLSSINATGCTELTHLYASNSSKLKTIKLTDCARLVWLEATNCAIETVVLRGDISLSGIYLDDNNLKGLNIPMAASDLTAVSVSNNPELKELSIRSMGNLTQLYASRCGLKTIDLSRGALLERVDVSCNELTELSLHINPLRLKDFRVFQNQFSRDVIKKLASSLPADEKSTDEKKFFVINTLGTTPREKNVCTKSAVAIAKQRGWDVYDYRGGEEMFYIGSDDPTTECVVLTTKRSKGKELTLDVKGDNVYLDLNGNNKLDEGEALVNGQNTLTLGNNSKVTLYGSNLVRLRAPFNDLIDVDLSQATKLQVVDVCNNALVSVDLSNQTQATEVDLSSNQLTTVVLPVSRTLELLNLAFNKLSTVQIPDYSQSLKQLWLNSNNLARLSLPQLNVLEELHMDVNKIELMTMRGIVEALNSTNKEARVKRFYAVRTTNTNEKNRITKSMVAQASEKGWVVYNGGDANYQGEEDEKLGDHTEFIAFTIGSGDIHDFIFYPKGENCWLDLNGNDNCDAGEEFDAIKGEEQFVTLGSERNLRLYGKKITEFRVNKAMGITKLDATKAPSLELLWVRENKLSEIALPNDSKLKNIDLSSNELAGIFDLTSHKKLEEVYLVTNNISEVKVNGLSNLRVLSLSENDISQLDVATLSNLKELYVASNKLSELDCSSLSGLETLSVYQNQLKSTAMQKLIEGMNSNVASPKYGTKNFTVMLLNEQEKKSEAEENELSDELILLANGKHWIVNGWKENGGIKELTDATIVLEQEPAVTIIPTGDGWKIVNSSSQASSLDIALFSIEGECLYRGTIEREFFFNTFLRKLVLSYGNTSVVLVR